MRAAAGAANRAGTRDGRVAGGRGHALGHAIDARDLTTRPHARASSASASQATEWHMVTVKDGMSQLARWLPQSAKRSWFLIKPWSITTLL